MNRTNLVAGVFALLLTPYVGYAQGTTTTSVSALLWEYVDSDVAAVVFRVCVDTSCSLADPATLRTATDATAPAGSSTYADPLPALSIGAHVATIAACDKDAPEHCGPVAEIPFRIVALQPVIAPRLKK
jgi:hypothetical protein